MSFENLPMLQREGGELINAGLAQQVGKGASAWVGGLGTTRGCVQCRRLAIWRSRLGGLSLGEMICNGLREGLLRYPQGVARRSWGILSSHPHPRPTERHWTLPLPILCGLC